MEIAKEDFIKSALQKYNITDSAIEKMKQKFMPLKIDGINDFDGYEKVKESRLFMKGKRIEVEKKRKELKEDSLLFGRAVDAEAKRITSLLLPIENHLDSQEKWVDSELVRIKFEKEQKEKLPSRIEKLAGINIIVPDEKLLKLDDPGFDSLFNNLYENYLEEREAQMRADQERIDVENRAIEDKQRAEQEKIEAEKKAIEDEKRKKEEEKQRAIEIKEAAERAKIEAEERIRQEAEEKVEKERLAKLEAERQEMLQPDKEKLLFLAQAIDDFKLPILMSDEGRKILNGTKILLEKVSEFLRIQSKLI